MKNPALPPFQLPQLALPSFLSLPHTHTHSQYKRIKLLQVTKAGVNPGFNVRIERTILSAIKQYLESVEDFREETGPVLLAGGEDEPRVLVAVAPGHDVGASSHLGLEYQSKY